MCWWDHFSRDQHQELVHSLGNLVLTWDNSSYGNRCFTDKRERPLLPNGDHPPCYLYGLHQEQRLADEYREWTPANIVSRQQKLAEWALQRCAVERPAPQALDSVAADEGGGLEPDEGDGAFPGRGIEERLLEPSIVQTYPTPSHQT